MPPTTLPMTPAFIPEPAWQTWRAGVAQAIRSLIANPRYSLPALLSLALGIGASTAVFAVFSAIVLVPLPFPNEHELVSVALEWRSGADRGTGFSAPFANDFVGEHDLFSAFAAYRTTEVTVQASGSSRRGVAATVSSEFFDALAIRAELGRTFTGQGTAPDGAGVAVLSHAYWASAFGEQAVVGDTILVEGEPRLVLGVLPAGVELPAFADLWIPIRYSEPEQSAPLALTLQSVARLRPGVALALAERRLGAKVPGLSAGVPEGTTLSVVLTPLREKLRGSHRSGAALMFGAVLAFLLLACANVAALLATKAQVRSRDQALRAALGASPRVLLFESGLEAIVLVLLAGMGGLGLALCSLRWVRQQGALAEVPVELDASVVAAFVALALVSTLLVGAVPALSALNVRPMDALRAASRSSASARSRRLSELLVVLQVAITLVLLGGAALLVQSVRRLQAVETGFAMQAVGLRVLYPPMLKDTRSVPWEVRDERADVLTRQVLEQAERLPGVTRAALASDLPFDGNVRGLMFRMEPGAPVPWGDARIHLVSPRYFEVLGIPLLSGRSFAAEDGMPAPDEAPPHFAVVVNRAFATRLIGTLDAVGHHVAGGRASDGRATDFEIVGVVEDVRDAALEEPVDPVLYGPFSSRFRMHGNAFALVVRGSGDADALLDAVVSATRSASAGAPIYGQTTLASLVEQSYWQRRVLKNTLGIFAVAALLLAAIGLFGVTGYAVAARSAEIGIRRALGARQGTILVLILRETAGIVALGMVLGLAGAWLGSHVLRAFVYGVAADDPLTYAGVCAGLSLIAMLAALGPALRAASVAPSRALDQG